MLSVPPLPVARVPTPWRPVRLIVTAVAQALALMGLAAVFSGVTIDGLGTALVAVVLMAALAAIGWPIVIRLALPIIALTVGLFTFVLDALLVLAVDAFVGGFEVDSIWWALLVALTVTVVNLAVGGLLHIDDDHVWRQRVVKRLIARRDSFEATDEPGILFIQVDGLGADVLIDAMASGYAPTLAALVEHGTHRLVRWECDLSSQTGAMQAGILLGDNRNMPAFRWYEKDTGRIMVSNRPRDAADIEARQSSGSGLLADGGASRANVFSGDADDAMLTFSKVIGNRDRRRSHLLYVVATPYALLRIVVLMLVDVVREWRDAWRAKRTDVSPRMHRGGSYPLLRAATTVGLTELTSAILVADVLRGVPSSYVDLVGYDEVAHHSGIAAREALETLRRTDEQIRRVLTVVEDAPRPYFVVVLSDHGQTQGATFRQRYGRTLADEVRTLAQRDRVEAPDLAEEGWHNLNGMLTDVTADDSRLGRTVARAVRKQTIDGEVRLGPDSDVPPRIDPDDIIVLASGNLGLVSFAGLAGRATRQAIDAAAPGLIDGLAAHPGIGFVMVRDEHTGDVVVGSSGVRNLADDVVDGDDPLAPFGPNAVDHLRRTAGFSNCPDLVINSFYDPSSDEGAAFEELIGFHGGLGGKQTAPFILAPTGLRDPREPLVGARAIHDLFTSWRSQIAEAR